MNIKRYAVVITTNTEVTFEEPVRLTISKSWKEDQDVLVEKMTLKWILDGQAWTLAGYGGVNLYFRKVRKDGTPFMNLQHDVFSLNQIGQTLQDVLLTAYPTQTIAVTEGNQQ